MVRRRLSIAAGALLIAGAHLYATPVAASETEPVPIAQIQGVGSETPYEGERVTTRGVVTAVYATGGLNGAYLQTPGTGGTLDLDAHDASHGLFVFGSTSGFAQDVEHGDFVEVTGTATEFHGLTQISLAGGGAFEVLDEPAEAVKATEVAFPLTEEQRESLEGMLIEPTNAFTLTNNYATNQWGELGLAAGDEPLWQPTEIALPGSEDYESVVAENAERLVTLDDGASTNFLSGAGQNTPLPWLAEDNEVRVGAEVTIDEPVILDWRHDLWRLQPTRHLTGDVDEPATIADGTRPAGPSDVGGDVTVAAFNVLNYFSTVGEEYAGGSCTYYTDRDGVRITNNRCENNGPRGAATAESLARQEAKIVAAITALDADVVGLQEIENSAAVGAEDRDEAVNTLVAALNAEAGEGTWAAVPSPAELPEDEDVIRTAFIYQPGAVETVGDSQILLGEEAYFNAREPLAQAFKPVGGADDEVFVAVNNHFKSKGSADLPEDEDTGDGQANANHSRVLQAQALVDFTDEVRETHQTDTAFLLGDFNSYSREDPVRLIEEAGYVNAAQEAGAGYTYQFGGLVGSLDHVFVSVEAADAVTGADIWSINADESIAREYSRFNYNVTNLYDASEFRSSDHDPIVVGFDVGGDVVPVPPTLGDLVCDLVAAVVEFLRSLGLPIEVVCRAG